MKKQLIMEKALELFAVNGFEATSIQQITECCGISKGAFYLSFKSKEELIFGLVDHFLSEIVADIEQVVSDEKPIDDLLYNYYYVTFSAFQKQADFAKIFIKEQITSFNVELLEKIQIYFSILNKVVLSIVERQFHYTAPHLQADLTFVIQGFMKHYSELFLHDLMTMDLNLLCTALVEKTTIIAKYATIQFLSPEFFSIALVDHSAPTKEQLIHILTQKINETDDAIMQESIALLKADLLEPNLSQAIIHGLLANLRTNPHCKWTAYLYTLYLKK